MFRRKLLLISAKIKFWLVANACLIVLCTALIGMSQNGHAASTTKETYPELLKDDKLYYNEHPSFEDEMRVAPEVAKMQLDS